MRTYNILLVDDDPFILKTIGKALKGKGYKVTTTDSGEKAIELLNKSTFDLVITDLVMGNINGFQVLKTGKRLKSEIMAIILTGHSDVALAIDALRFGADDYLLKPCEPEEMYFRIENCLEKLKIRNKIWEAEERFRTVADFAYDWEYWVAPDGNYIYVSPSCERISGYRAEEFLHNPNLLKTIVHPDDHAMVIDHHHEALDTNEILPIDFRIITRSGDERWISHVCQPVYGTDGTHLGQRGTNRDISKRKKMQEELLKAKKLESLGILAGGIAHDFNNMMTVVRGNISLAKLETKPKSTAFELLTEAEKASLRANDLTARLITFSKGGEPIKKTLHIGKFLNDSVTSALNGHDIDCNFSIPADISPVEIDEIQMKQVIGNIIINAGEAMSTYADGASGRSGERILNVYCENADTGEKDGLMLKNGKYVKISIKDQGPGIPDENIPKVFDPYFSTKNMDAQEGMGLGLAVCHSIVEKHGGLINVESELGVGTTFFIYLPASEKEIAMPEPATTPESWLPDIGKRKILIMDDEEMVRRVAGLMLSQLGHDVEFAEDGIEAIELYKKAKESGKPFDAVILDLTNHFGMGGKKAIVKLLEIDPDVKAIISSGYSNDQVMANYRQYGFSGVMPKPYTKKELSYVLAEAV